VPHLPAAHTHAHTGSSHLSATFTAPGRRRLLWAHHCSSAPHPLLPPTSPVQSVFFLSAGPEAPPAVTASGLQHPCTPTALTQLSPRPSLHTHKLTLRPLTRRSPVHAAVLPGRPALCRRRGSPDSHAPFPDDQIAVSVCCFSAELHEPLFACPRCRRRWSFLQLATSTAPAAARRPFPLPTHGGCFIRVLVSPSLCAVIMRSRVQSPLVCTNMHSPSPTLPSCLAATATHPRLACKLWLEQQGCFRASSCGLHWDMYCLGCRHLTCHLPPGLHVDQLLALVLCERRPLGRPQREVGSGGQTRPQSPCKLLWRR
jgi:hypothetical protein